METKNIINIPEGYEIDREKSTERQIVLKKIKSKKIVLKKIERPRTWEEYCKKMRGKDSYFYDDFIIRPETFGSAPILSEFADKEDLEAFIAYSNLLKLRKDWIGDWKPDWTKTKYKFSIITKSNNVCQGINTTLSRSMSFPTAEMRDDFLDCFKDLIEQAKRFI